MLLNHPGELHAAVYGKSPVGSTPSLARTLSLAFAVVIIAVTPSTALALDI